MNWPAYPEYCPTAIEGVGEAPTAWVPIKLRHVLSLNPPIPGELREQ